MRIQLTGIYAFIAIITWLIGIVYAFQIGFWHGMASICLGPFYAWYLVTKNLMIYFGILHGCF